MRFEVFFNEAREGYLLGSHSAREGEHVRGMPRKSTIADIGFINRDPEEDIKHPTSPTPAGVKATYNVITDAFNKLIQNKEAKEQFISTVEEFVGNWNTIKNTLPPLYKAIERVASLQKTLLTAKPQSVDRLQSMLDWAKDQRDELAETINRAATYINDNEATILDKLQYILLENCDDRAKLKSAMDRYFSVVNHRKEEAKNTGGMEYLTITPVISLVKFFNNTLNNISRTGEKATAIKKFKSSKSALASLGGGEEATILTDLFNLVKLTAPKLRDNPQFIGSVEHTAAKQKAHQLALRLKLSLPENVFHAILVTLNRFFTNEMGSEGEITRLILNTAPKALISK
jgi:hypothetical protein